MKKILSLLLVALLFVTMFSSVTVFAAKTPTFVVSNEKANVGDTVKITISTKNNPGIVSMKLLIKYNGKALKLVEHQEGKFSNTAFSPKESNPFVVNWLDSIHPNNKTNGVVATLTFKVLDTAPNGKSDITLTYDPEDVFNLKFKNVTFEVQNGYVDITNPNANSSQTASSKDEEVSSDTFNDTTANTILGQIHQSANQNQSSEQSQTESLVTGDDVGSESSEKTNNNTQSDWIIWVVAAACVALVGVFVVIIIKNKKDKTDKTE